MPYQHVQPLALFLLLAYIGCLRCHIRYAGFEIIDSRLCRAHHRFSPLQLKLVDTIRHIFHGPLPLESQSSLRLGVCRLGVYTGRVRVYFPT